MIISEDKARDIVRMQVLSDKRYGVVDASKVTVVPRWPDYVISTSQLVFAVALLPSLLTADKPALLTCWLTLGGMLAMFISFVKLDLRFSILTSGLSVALWWLLALQQSGVLP